MISIKEVTAGLKRGPARFLEELISYAIGCTSGKVFLCTETIAQNTRYTRRYVFYGLKVLEAEGGPELIKRENRPDLKRGGLTTNLYHLKGKAAAYVAEQRAQKQAAATARAAAALAYVKRVARVARASTAAFLGDRYEMGSQRLSSKPDHKEKEARAAREDNKWRASLPEIRASLGAVDDQTPISELWAARRRLEQSESP